MCCDKSPSHVDAALTSTGATRGCGKDVVEHLLYKLSTFNLLAGFGESAVFLPQHEEGDKIRQHCAFNEIGLVDPPTITRLIISR